MIVEKFTVGACWSGDYYDVQYINNLFNAVSRNTTIPFDFVLYLGPRTTQEKLSKLNPSIKTHQTNRPFWWSGMEFWKKYPPLVETETLLYLDLDVVIVGNLDDIICYPSDHCLMKDYPSWNCPPGCQNDGNASVTLIRNGVANIVWEEYANAGHPTWDPANPPSQRPLPLAAQGIVNKMGVAHDVFPEKWIQSYKLSVLETGLDKDCKVVSFHGQPKPHNCLHEKFVLQNWR